MRRRLDDAQANANPDGTVGLWETQSWSHVQDLAGHLGKVSAIQLPTDVPIGRYGAFKYNNQDHSILMGILAAEQLLTDNNYDLWSVNTDYESYQEQATITESGLVTTAAAT